jgi:phosphoglycerol transferase MdoB-like AlkP superfamily enzyme
LKKSFPETDFGSADKTQRWGVDDQKLLTSAVNEISALQQPFFATALTLSLHPP